MKLVRRVLIASSFALAAQAFVLQAPVLQAPVHAAAVSQAVGKALNEAKVATSAAGVEAAIGRANAAATTPAEKGAITDMAIYAYNKVGARGKAAAVAASAGKPAATVAQLYYAAGDFGNAITYGNRAGGKSGMLIVAQSQVRMGKACDAAKSYKSLISIAGQQMNYLSNLAAQQNKCGDREGFKETLTKIVRIDPSPKNWAGVLSGLKTMKMPDQARLGLFLLIDQTGNLSQTDEIAEMSKLSMVLGAPGLAKSVLAKGIAGDPTIEGLKKMVPQQEAKANSDLASLSKMTDATSLMKTGRIYLGAGNYPKALESFAAASKAAGANPSEAALYTGITQFRAGNLAAAKAAFSSIKTKDAYGDLASMWSLFASTRG